MDDISENVNSYSKETRQNVYAEFSKEVDAKQIANIAGVVEVQNIDNNKWLIVGNGLIDIRPNIFDFAVKNAVQVLSLHEQQQSLEDVFREVTK